MELKKTFSVLDFHQRFAKTKESDLSNQERRLYPYLKCIQLQKNLTLLLGCNRPYNCVYQKTNDPYIVEEYSLRVVISQKGATRVYSYLASVIHSE